MAKIKKLPGDKVISGFRGILDFYLYMGIVCVRKWPKKPSMPRSPASTATATIFGYAAHIWGQLSPEIMQAYQETAAESSLTARDTFVKSFIKDYFREGQWD